MSDTVNIGVIGAGSIFEDRHFPALSEMDDVKVVAIANRSVDSAREASQRFNLGAEPLDDPDAVIARDDVDAIMVGTWPYKHHQYTLSALDAGKHVFVQARMATSLAEAKEMYHRSRETDLVTQICPSPFAMKGDEFVQELLDDGYLGELHFVRGHVMSDDGIDPTRPRSWREVERYQGVNALAVGILLERLHGWIGHASAVSAMFETQIENRPYRDGNGTAPVELPDVVTINCRFENGALGTFDFSEVTGHSPSNQIELYGSEGTLIYDITDDTLRGGKPNDETLTEITIPDENAVEWTVEEDFVEAIRHGGSPRATFREGTKYMEFSDAVCRAVETGSTVRLPRRGGL